jgi:hypothetical protein
MSKNVPNLRQPSTGPTIYAPMKLPPLVTIPLAVNPHIPSRAPSAPLVPNRTPAMTPANAPTNRPGVPVK